MFPYIERRTKRPDPPQLAQATVRAAVGAASALLPEHPHIAGGKSFGGRMMSQAQAKAPLQGIRGLAFPAGRPSQDRAAHLFDVQIPMLFLQDTRDPLASLDQIEPRRRSFLSCISADRAERRAGSCNNSGRAELQPLRFDELSIQTLIESFRNIGSRRACP